MTIEIDITSIVHGTDPARYSCSQAEAPGYAGPGSWAAALQDAARLLPVSLVHRNPYGSEPMTEEKFDEAIAEWLQTFGAWDAEEIAAMGVTGRRALLVQFISGDIRECDIRPEMSAEDWADLEARSAEGQVPGRIGRGDDGRVWFTME